MPRAGRGAKPTTAKPGAAPIVHLPSRVYGQAAELARSQHAVRMGAPEVASPGSPGGGQPAAIPPGGVGPELQRFHDSGQFHALMNVEPPYGDLTGPTQRPDEPLTYGSPSGPGAGPEAAVPAVVDPVMAAVASLNALGDKASPVGKGVRSSVNAMLGNAGAL